MECVKPSWSDNVDFDTNWANKMAATKKVNQKLALYLLFNQFPINKSRAVPDSYLLSEPMFGGEARHLRLLLKSVQVVIVT